MTPSPIIIHEFMDAVAQRAELDFNRQEHQAFVAWYVEAEFGRPSWDFTDAAGDGGVDGVVWLEGASPAVVLLQSKFSARLGGSLLSREAYHEFDNVVAAFRYGGRDFEAFIATVRPDAKRIYRKAHEWLTESAPHWNTRRKAFRLITTRRPRSAEESSGIPRTAYVYGDDIMRLYAQYRRGQTPRANDLLLRIEGKLAYRDARRGVTSFLFNARVSDFRTYLATNDVGRLVARNIRYELGGKISRDIRDTYEDDPANFWYVHNGLTIICDHCTEEDENVTLTNPSVVNGAQTLYSIASSPRTKSTALVATRVIVRKPTQIAPEDDEWVQKVIRGVNTQNRVRAQDFRSNEPEQLELQRLFREQHVFYERKRGEWREYRNEPRFRNFRRTSIRVIGQVLAATSARDGSGVVRVKRGVEVIFRDHYSEYFPPRAKLARRFARIYLAYRIADFIRRNAYSSAAEFRKQRHAFWTTVWLFHLGMTDLGQNRSSPSAARIRIAFDRFEGTGRAAQHARALAKRTRRLIWTAWRTARSSDQERWSSVNFFKSKWGHKKLLTLVLPKVRRDLKALAAEIDANG